MNWKTKKLGEIFTIERGGSPRPIQKYLTDSPDGINWIKISDATASDKYIYKTKEKITKEGLHKTRIVNEGDFILSNSMSFGRPYIMKTTGCIHDGWLVLKQNGERIFETEFLYHLLSSPFVYSQFDSLAAGSTVRNLNIALVSSVEVPLPPLHEQQRIVSILDKAFAAIDQAKANAEKNLQNAKELFESYLQGVFENKGEGWIQTTLSDLFDVKHGFAFQGKYFSNKGEYVLLTPGNFYEEGGYRDRGEKQKYYNGEIPSGFILKKGDLLVAMTEQAAGLLGSPIIVPESNKFLHNQRLGLIIPKPDVEIDNEFFYHVFNLKKVRQTLHDSGTGVKVRHTSPKKIGQVEISYPKTKMEQRTIVRQLNVLRAETQKLETVYQKKIAALDELKKSILQKAFAGELEAKKQLTI